MPRGFFFLPDDQADLSTVWDKSIKQTQTPVQKDTFQRGETPRSRGRSQMLPPAPARAAWGQQAPRGRGGKDARDERSSPPARARRRSSEETGAAETPGPKFPQDQETAPDGACSARCYHLGGDGAANGTQLDVKQTKQVNTTKSYDIPGSLESMRRSVRGRVCCDGSHASLDRQTDRRRAGSGLRGLSAGHVGSTDTYAANQGRDRAESGCGASGALWGPGALRPGPRVKEPSPTR